MNIRRSNRYQFSEEQLTQLVLEAMEDVNFLEALLKEPGLQQLPKSLRRELERLRKSLEADKNDVSPVTKKRTIKARRNSSNLRRQRRSNASIIEGFKAEKPTLDVTHFFEAPAWSREETEVVDFLRDMAELYGPDLVPAESPYKTNSALELYKKWLEGHEPYRKFWEADDKIIDQNRRQFRQWLTGSYLVELGPGTGGKTRHLFSIAAPDYFDGVEIIRECRMPLMRNVAPFFQDPSMIRFIKRNFCDDALWQGDIGEKWKNARSEFSVRRKVFALFGLTIGNLSEAQLGRLFYNFAQCASHDDIFIVSNDATGTIGDPVDAKTFNIAREIKGINHAYRPRGIEPYCHYVGFNACMREGLSPFNHGQARVFIGFNPDNETVERRLEFSAPQIIRRFGIANPVATITELHLPASAKRSLSKIDLLARQNGLKIVASLPDPTRRTRVSIIALARMDYAAG